MIYKNFYRERPETDQFVCWIGPNGQDVFGIYKGFSKYNIPKFVNLDNKHGYCPRNWRKLDVLELDMVRNRLLEMYKNKKKLVELGFYTEENITETKKPKTKENVIFKKKLAINNHSNTDYVFDSNLFF
jgi:hypothetical protein